LQRGTNRLDSLVVVDVASAEAEAGHARVEVVPLVQRKGDGQSLVLRSIAVRVADERRLPVVVQYRVGDAHESASVRDINETVVKVFVVITVGGNIDVVNPDLGSRLDRDGISGAGENLGHLEVSDDHVVLLNHAQADSDEGGARLAQDGLVGADFDDGVACDCARHENDLGGIVSEGRGKRREG
jgi:hypothetical protein